jgi:hypothetical protein
MSVSQASFTQIAPKACYARLHNRYGGRPNPAAEPDESVALKQPVAACGKLRLRFMEPSWIARSAQMPLVKYLPLNHDFSDQHPVKLATVCSSPPSSSNAADSYDLASRIQLSTTAWHRMGARTTCASGCADSGLGTVAE